jgi:hypothetical protein
MQHPWVLPQDPDDLSPNTSAACGGGAALRARRVRFGTLVVAALAAANADVAATCSAARLLAPDPRTVMESLAITHSTSNTWLCAAPWVATTA